MEPPAEPPSSSPRSLRARASARSLRSVLDVSGIAARSVVSLDELSEAEERISAADEFSRLVGEISMNRRLHAPSCSSLQRMRSLRSLRSMRSLRSLASSDDGRSRDDESALRLCCCERADCDAARRVARHVADMESDLQLSAEIGQALLRRQDAIVFQSQQASEEHAQQRDVLLARLSSVIKENKALERQLEQANFNLESADHSHRALLSELDEARRQARSERTAAAKARALEARLEKAYAELHDARDALYAERVRRHGDPPPAALAPPPAPASECGSDSAPTTSTSDGSRTDITTPRESDVDAFSVAGSEHERHDARTTLLAALVEWVQRTAGRLRSADVDTLAQRLSRQKLAGDVAHLSRTTVNALLRDIEGVRDLFRREIEREAKLDLPRDPDESLVLRRDFFALLKLFRDMLVDMSRLRLCVNEIQLAPGNAARLLQQHLGTDMSAHLRSSWLARMFTLGLGEARADADAPPPGESAFTRILGVNAPATPAAAAPPAPAQPARVQRPRGAPRLMPRTSAAVMPSSVAVQVRGSQTATVVGGDGGGALAHTRLPSHASALYAAGEDRPAYPRRIRDDDQVSVRRGGDAALRPRGLSDSSIRSTFLEHADAPPVDRVLTAESLAAHA